MELRERGSDPPPSGLPEDVSALYSWANIRGLRYHNFLASRRATHRSPSYIEAESDTPERVRSPLAMPAPQRPFSGEMNPSAAHPMADHGLAPVVSRGLELAEAEAFPYPEPAIAENDFPDELRLTPLETSPSLSFSDDLPALPRGRVPLLWRSYRTEDSSAVWRTLGSVTEAAVPNGLDRPPAMVERAQPPPVFGPETPLYADPNPGMIGRTLLRAAAGGVATADSPDANVSAWPFGPASLRVGHALSLARHEDTLQDSRERMAARWYALKGVFNSGLPALPAPVPDAKGVTRAPLLLVFSLAGGVGKTSLAATLGRALSAQGERVLLADTTSHGLLPFYFGARELRDGVLRTFSAPEGSQDSPIDLVSYDLASTGDDEPRQAALTERILGNARGGNRLVLDLAQGTSWMVRRLAKLRPTVLVPLTPEMNSVITLQSVERLFHGVTDEDGRPLLPFYVLNQFDATLPLHLDVREVFRSQLGDRLLHRTIRRAPVIAEAQAEGMTVIDYAPDAPVVKDYFDIAAWLRRISPPAMQGLRALPTVSHQADRAEYPETDGSGE